MACDLTKGRKEPCKDSVGGIKAVYFADFGDITIAYDSTDTDVVDDLGTVTVFKYELKGNSSFEQTITSSRENGTTFFEQALNLTLKKLTVQDHKELKLMSYGRPHIVVEDYNGNAFLMGAEHGCDVTGGTIATGAAMGDMSGYTLTFSAMEQVPANFLEGATEADPFAGLTGTVTVTQGTNS
tara:strand:- start:900 stop:1448 length:549 start_codon:yes stop_codon:yes gene_type:complete